MHEQAGMKPKLPETYLAYNVLLIMYKEIDIYVCSIYTAQPDIDEVYIVPVYMNNLKWNRRKGIYSYNKFKRNQDISILLPSCTSVHQAGLQFLYILKDEHCDPSNEWLYTR